MKSNQQSNYKGNYNTDEFYNLILKTVSTNLKRPLEYGEQKETIRFIKNMDPDLLTPKLQKKTISIMIKTLVTEFTSYKCEEPIYYDSMQELKNVIGKSSESGTTHGVYDKPSFKYNNEIKQQPIKQQPIKQQPIKQQPIKQQSTTMTTNNISNTTEVNNLFGIKNASDFVRILNPKSKERRNHMLLDSRYRVASDQSVTQIKSFQWNYIQKSQSRTDGSVNVIGNVRDIIGLRIYPFRIPYAADSDNKYTKISLFIQELGAQSFIAHEDRKFHFMLNASIDGSFINLDADVYNGYFWFEKPITTLNTLTLSFGNPLEPILFESDRDYCSFDYFIEAPETVITTEKTHKLENGDRVYFTNFDVGDLSPILSEQITINQNIKNIINDVNGHLITIISSNVFKINIDSSLIQSPIENLRSKVFYGSKRTFIPIEIIYMYPDTNDI
jgi:hypothetical protein